ncbi:hypothetical protein HJJEPNFP_00019 [Ralstonia phage BOESR1]|uniref:Uncharacterized protein n=1 Tax=Ralstonia phage BOESR1 TaxID=3034917 RepID=A0AA50F2U1_9CAUD|nr:hypothetical protein HJJEPNFP_00019 [Ralstonia phage BOESR1]WLW40597.1 hypothetical protein HIBIKMCM_00030 [Ralstonia phage BOESR1]
MFKDDFLKEVLIVAFLDPFKIQSDFARLRSQEVAALASLGFISTLEAPGVYGRKWRITGVGIDKLRDLGAL